jgi:hypothetical protein
VFGSLCDTLNCSCFKESWQQHTCSKHPYGSQVAAAPANEGKQPEVRRSSSKESERGDVDAEEEEDVEAGGEIIVPADPDDVVDVGYVEGMSTCATNYVLFQSTHISGTVF